MHFLEFISSVGQAHCIGSHHADKYNSHLVLLFCPIELRPGNNLTLLTTK